MKQVATIKGIIGVFPHGIDELKRSSKKYLAWALLISVSLHLAALGGYFLGSYLTREEEPPPRIVRIVKYTELGPPPSITDHGPPPAVAVSVPVARPSIGVPVPVPDAEISKEVTIPTQQEMAEIAAPISGAGKGESYAVSAPSGDEEPGIDENVVVQVPPVAVVQVEPEYPKAAREVGLQGTVFVKVLVDKEGKVKKAVPLRGPEMFYPSACAAAMKWVFKPAIQKDKPIAVWVMIPFHFSQGD